MKKITKEEWNSLNKAGLLKHKKSKNGIIVQEPNYCVTNRQHKGSQKTYYIVEDYKLLSFLGYVKPRKKNFKNNDR